MSHPDPPPHHTLHTDGYRARLEVTESRDGGVLEWRRFVLCIDQDSRGTRVDSWVVLDEEVRGDAAIAERTARYAQLHAVLQELLRLLTLGHYDYDADEHLHVVVAAVEGLLEVRPAGVRHVVTRRPEEPAVHIWQDADGNFYESVEDAYTARYDPFAEPARAAGLEPE